MKPDRLTQFLFVASTLCVYGAPNCVAGSLSSSCITHFRKQPRFCAASASFRSAGSPVGDPSRPSLVFSTHRFAYSIIHFSVLSVDCCPILLLMKFLASAYLSCEYHLSRRCRALADLISLFLSLPSSGILLEQLMTEMLLRGSSCIFRMKKNFSLKKIAPCWD